MRTRMGMNVLQKEEVVGLGWSRTDAREAIMRDGKGIHKRRRTEGSEVNGSEQG